MLLRSIPLVDQNVTKLDLDPGVSVGVISWGFRVDVIACSTSDQSSMAPNNTYMRFWILDTRISFLETLSEFRSEGRICNRGNCKNRKSIPIDGATILLRNQR